MPHEWISTVTVMALSVLVLSTVTLTTQQYVFSLEDALAEDKLQDLTDEVASKVMDLYKIGHKSDAEPSASEPIIDIANTRLTLLERIITKSYYRVVLNNSTGSVEAYLLSDPSVKASTSLQGINKGDIDTGVDLSGDAWSGNNTYIWYKKRDGQKDLITINNGVFEFFQLVLVSNVFAFYLQPPRGRASGIEMNLTNVGTNDVNVYWIELIAEGGHIYYTVDSDLPDPSPDPPDEWWTLESGTQEDIRLYFGPAGQQPPPPVYLNEYHADAFPNFLDPGDELTIIFYFDQVAFDNLASSKSQGFTIILPEP